MEIGDAFIGPWTDNPEHERGEENTRGQQTEEGQRQYVVLGYRANRSYPSVRVWGLYGSMDRAKRRQIEMMGIGRQGQGERNLLSGGGFVTWIRILQIGRAEGIQLW